MHEHRLRQHRVHALGAIHQLGHVQINGERAENVRLVTEKKMNRDEAYILCSVAVDLHVTQLVDGTKGVHAMLAKSMFTR